MTIFYKYAGKLYVNVTNRCPCNCIFCIRNNGDSVGESDSLWLEHEPTMDEIKAAYEAIDSSDCPEVVFCGYGEPLERLDIVLQTCDYLRSVSNMKIRINTNGLSDLINGKPTAHLFKGRADTMSISLNAATAEEYVRVTQPSFGKSAFPSLLQFAKDCKAAVPRVLFTLVDVISPEEVSASQALADELGIPLRVRAYQD